MKPEAIPEKPKTEFFKCFLCKAQVETRLSKRGKPYFICDPCGVQAFIRKDRGIRIFKTLISGKPETQNSTLELITQKTQLLEKLEDIRTQKLFSFGANDLGVQEKAISNDISRIDAELIKRAKK